MLTSLSLIFLVGLAMGAICQRLKLPRIIGMLVTGIILGPYVLDFLDPSILSISAELRKMALIIILLKAGLSLDLKDLKKAGRCAVLLSFVPATCEIIGYVLFAPSILGISRIDAAVMGAVLGAVSPAGIQSELANWFGRDFEKVQIAFTSNLGTNAGVMAMNGLGYPISIEGAAKYWRQDLLVQRRLSPEIKASTVIAWRRNIPYSRAIQLFIDEINAFKA